MSEAPTLLGVILLCVLAEGFFSGSEIAIVSSRWLRLRQEAERGDRRAAILVRLWRDPDRLLATTLVGTNLSVITASVLAVSLAVDLVGSGSRLMNALAGREEVLVTLCLTPVTLLLGEIIPKSVFQSGSERMAKRVVYPMAAAWALFYPITSVLVLITGLVKKSVRARVETSPFVTREELAMVVKQRDLKSELKKHEKRMIRRLFTFRETLVREVMVPLVRVAAHEEGATLEQALAAFSRLPYTRYPVFRKRMFNIVGVLNVLSCLQETNSGKKVGRLMEPPYYVPENRSVIDVLRDMERDKVRMAIAVDEYGGAVGIITLEDVLEEIVGELEDEHEPLKGGIRRLGPTSWEIDAHVGLDHVSEKLGLAFPEGDYETLAGLIMQRLGRIPRPGDEVRLENLTLKALETDRRTVGKVLLTVDTASETSKEVPRI